MTETTLEEGKTGEKAVSPMECGLSFGEQVVMVWPVGKVTHTEVADQINWSEGFWLIPMFLSPSLLSQWFTAQLSVGKLLAV